VTAEDVQRVAAKYLIDDRTSVVHVIPPREGGET
jgi:predicted Zn-dependent peptidase